MSCPTVMARALKFCVKDAAAGPACTRTRLKSFVPGKDSAARRESLSSESPGGIRSNCGWSPDELVRTELIRSAGLKRTFSERNSGTTSPPYTVLGPVQPQIREEQNRL